MKNRVPNKSLPYPINQYAAALAKGSTLLIFALSAGTARANEGVAAGAEAPAPADDTVADLEEVIVTGTRRAGGLQASESPAPIQVLSADTLQSGSLPDLSNSLAAAVPSFTSQSFGGDMANQTLSAKLRGLSPNHALVLINGKRRHTTASLAVLGGPYQGGAATDLNFIPTSAIDHIEVLTDGAAAQYGTDAIAGVINIILKKDSSGGLLNATAGGFVDGGGTTDAYSANAGMGNSDGYLNLTLEVHNQQRTDRGGIDPRVVSADTLSTYPNSNMTLVPGYPYLNQIMGSPEFHKQIAFANAGYNFGAVELYSFASYGKKQAESYENYRLPQQGGGYTTTTTDSAGDTVTTTEYMYPYGFSPEEASKEEDLSFTAGLKGNLATWDWDLSSTYGKDRVEVYTLDSMNFDLYADTGTSPSDFYDGAYVADQLTSTLDLVRDFDVGLAMPLNVAFGAEEREESYELEIGDPASRYGSGASSFPGIQPVDAGRHTRSNYAAYVDLSTNPVEAWTVDAAARYEHYNDFGSTTIGKLTSRYDFTDDFAIRGTVSSGFRAPTLAEEYYSATNVGPNSAFVQMAPNASAASLLGLGDGLKAEKSTNFSAGFVAHVNQLTATVDAYQIEIRDRIVGSGSLYSVFNGEEVAGSEAITNAIIANGNTLDPSAADYIGINIFANGLTTRTRGLDVVMAYPGEYAFGHIDWTASANVNKTKVTKVNASPSELGGQPLYDETAISDLEDASPKFRANFGGTWTYGPYSLMLRETIYGKSSERVIGDDGVYYTDTIKTTPITDFELGFKPIPTVTISAGAQNAFNEYPDKRNAKLMQTFWDNTDNSAVSVYPSFSPFGFNGAYYYGKISYVF